MKYGRKGIYLNIPEAGLIIRSLEVYNDEFTEKTSLNEDITKLVKRFKELYERFGCGKYE